MAWIAEIPDQNMNRISFRLMSIKVPINLLHNSAVASFAIVNLIVTFAYLWSDLVY